MKEAAEAVASLTQQEMESFVDQMESQLKTLETKADDLNSRAQNLQGEAKTASRQENRNPGGKAGAGPETAQSTESLERRSLGGTEDGFAGVQMLRLNQALQEAAAAFD